MFMQRGRVFSLNIKLELDEMKYTKGFRFHPTDAEAIEHLWDKMVLDRDSIVQVGDSLVPLITQLKDICKFEPWELPGRSELQSGDKVWYFFCSPEYKYRNSKRKNRVTKKGYWKPTGKPRKIVTTYDGKKIAGIKQTLVFYNGRVCDKNKNENKTPWVMHELELTPNLPNQKSLILCKLKKTYGKVDVSSGEEHSKQSLPSNLENHCTSNEILKIQGQLHSTQPLTEPVALTEYSESQSELVNNEQTVDEFVDSLLIKNDEFYFVHDKEYQNECVWAMNQVGCSSVHVANDPTYSNGDNKQHSNTLFAKEGSSLSLENHVPAVSIPIDGDGSEFDEFLHNGIFMAELLPVPEAPKHSDEVQNHQFSINEQDEFWNSIFLTTDEVEAYPELFRSMQHNLITTKSNMRG